MVLSYFLRVLLRFGTASLLAATLSAAEADASAARASPNPAANRAADPALIPPVLNTRPGVHYAAGHREFALNQGVERTPRGRLWSCWISGEDGEGGYMLLASSDDDGVTWSEPRLVIHPHDASLSFPRRTLVGNIWTDPLGRLWIFFDQSMINFDGRAGTWAAVCEDPDAAEPRWSEPRRLWHGCALNKPVVLRNGEWLLPVSLWDRVKIREMPFRDAFKELDALRGANLLVSLDQGLTWSHRGATVKFPNPDYDEHMLIERSDGSLWMTARTKDSMWESFSRDNGRTWSAPRPAAIAHRNARHFIRRLHSGNLLLVKHGLGADVAPNSRSDLTAFLSDDEGVSWKGGLLLDAGVSVSYPDGTQAPDGTIYVTYDNERSRKGEVLLARFAESDVLAGRFTSTRASPRMLVSRALGMNVKQQEASRARGAFLQKQRAEHEVQGKRGAVSPAEFGEHAGGHAVPQPKGKPANQPLPTGPVKRAN
ncbi:MAG: exo-alpha-sialidase [Verrucomicrobia bacterium]|nr:exo-alpha-sialidase [Verrucomicrobiota bacterium]